MPICNICNKEVSKRQSLAYKDGRACKDHPEVIEASNARLNAEEQQRQQQLAEQRKRFEHKNRFMAPPVPKGPQCWCCHKDGIHARDHFLRMMIANEKCCQQGKNPLDGNAMKEAYGEVKPILLTIPVKSTHFILDHIRDGHMMHEFAGGLIFICYECAKIHHLGEVWKNTFHPKVNLTVEQIVNWTAIAQSLPITKLAHEIAKVELELEKQE